MEAVVVGPLGQEVDQGRAMIVAGPISLVPNHPRAQNVPDGLRSGELSDPYGLRSTTQVS